MNKLFVLFFSFISLVAFSQPNVYLRFEHKIGGEPIAFNQEYTEPVQGYEFSITRLEYYISEISVQHDGGQVTEIDNTWLLVKSKDAEDYNLGKHDIENVEAISFYIGVDPEHNHLDPTTYPSGHPLAPQNPSMHWGWAAGYRFVCLEGKTGINLLFTYEIHALGDANYFETSIPTSAIWEGDDLIIILNADYLGMFNNINVSTGLIEHGETGAALTLLQNFSSEVYSQVLFTGIEQGLQSSGVRMYPNPCYNGNVTIQYNLENDSQGQLMVSDMTGKKIFEDEIYGTSAQAINLA